MPPGRSPARSPDRPASELTPGRTGGGRNGIRRKRWQRPRRPKTLVTVSDNSLLIAGLTGVTAILASSLASWLTSRGNARAARIQADTVTAAQRSEGIRQSRQAAYLNLVEQAQVVADGLAEVDPLARNPHESRPADLELVLEAHRGRHSRLRRAVSVIDLEGPSDVARAAGELQVMSGRLTTALAAVIEDGSRDNRHEFRDILRAYLRLLRIFVNTAAAALERA